MQKIIQIVLVTCTYFVFLQGCKKDNDEEENPNSWTEEFINMEELIQQKQWLAFNNSIEAYGATWTQGFHEPDKMGGYIGFPAYSYATSGDAGEYAFVGQTSFTLTSVVSSWLVTPPLELKNGDKFSFYTRCDSNIIAPHTLEIRLTQTAYPTPGNGPAEVGSFNHLLNTVNPDKTQNGYPKTWKKIEVTVSGLPADGKGRIAFRYMSQGQLDGGIGIDQLVYTSK